ncbi:SDR family oxidoreductase [Nocardioides daphniae]|uniref:SDR family oxidoreductase n=1 Tax=Nocardioides daphniae TaxID=402297 RepID=UPI001EE79CF9|nr:SDR family oxidoreductase [Nocardioides daphniae]
MAGALQRRGRRRHRRGHGIGAALARRLVAEGARVVVNDLDAEAAWRVAHEVGGTAVPGNCASEDGVRSLLAHATQALGRVDLYMANAGLDHVQGEPVDWLETSDAAWSTLQEVNVMAHVRAARALVPEWLETGGGRSSSASAAGLLTMLGAAPYSVTKHAAVGFAEWLSATYGHRGIAVQAICPQGVQTRMLEEAGPLKELLSADSVLSPDDVAQAWVESLADDASSCCRTPRWPTTTAPERATPTAGSPGCAASRPASTHWRTDERPAARPGPRRLRGVVPWPPPRRRTRLGRRAGRRRQVQPDLPVTDGTDRWIVRRPPLATSRPPPMTWAASSP